MILGLIEDSITILRHQSFVIHEWQGEVGKNLWSWENFTKRGKKSVSVRKFPQAWEKICDQEKISPSMGKNLSWEYFPKRGNFQINAGVVWVFKVSC